MSAEQVMQAISQFCKNQSGDPQTWQGNKSTYQWNRGRDTDSGTINGVVRKVAGIDVQGNKIWVVAGSFKIGADGAILRFTGLPQKFQSMLFNVGTIQNQIHPVTSEV